MINLEKKQIYKERKFTSRAVAYLTDIILFQPKTGSWDMMGARVPLGLLSIVAIPYKKKYKIKLIDQRLDDDWKGALKTHLPEAKILCLTTMIGEQIKFMLEAARFAKSIKPDVLIFLGGGFAKAAPDICISDESIDVVCYGEGDYLIEELMEFCEGKKEIEEIKGIFFKQNGTVKKNQLAELIENLDELPRLPYELAKMEDYVATTFRSDQKSISIVTSRGCGFNCTFCSTASSRENKWRGYSVERILSDMAFLERTYGFKDFYLSDDNLAADYNRFSRFIRVLAESNKDYNWGTSGVRADSVVRWSEEDMENLVKSGCKNLDIGAETGSPRILKLIKKGTIHRIIREANLKLSKYPIIIKYTFIGGYPTETEEEFNETLEFRKLLLKENEYATAPLFFYTPVPKTEMFNLAVSNGFTPPTTLAAWADFNFSTWYYKYPSWLSKKRIKAIENASFLSFSSNKELSYKFGNPLMNFLFRLYFPIAHFRNKHNFHRFFIEKKLADAIGHLNNKYNLFSKFQKKK